MTDHEQQYDPQLQWVIDEVIFFYHPTETLRRYLV